MSVPSSKMATTCEKPNFETERSSSKPLQASHRVLDREGDEPLDLLGRELGGDGVDLDLHRRRVGEGVERQAHGRADPDDDEEPGEQAARRSGSSGSNR